MAISIRGGAPGFGSNGGSSATVSASSVDSSPQVGDLCVVIHGNDFYTTATMPTPTATGSPTLTPITNGTCDAGTNLTHIKSYTYVVNTAGTQTVSVTETGAHDEDKYIVIYPLAGADTSTPVDAASNTSGGSANSQPASSVSPTSSNAFIILANNAGGATKSSAYASPGGSTEQYEIHTGTMSAVGATQQLAASGPTGTFTFTATDACLWGSITLAIKTASAGATVNIDAASTVTDTRTATAALDLSASAALTVTDTRTATANVDPVIAGALTVTNARTATANIDPAVTAALTVTDTLTAAASTNPGMLASLTVLDTITALAQSDLNVAAALTVTNTRTAAATVSTTGGDQLLLPYADMLLACLCTALEALPNPPGICCIRAGDSTIQDMGPTFDECCEGQAYVRISGFYPTGYQNAPFPSPSTDFAINSCGVPAWALQLEMGVFRCIDTSGELSCTDWTAVTAQQMADAKGMRQALCCFIADLDPSTVAIGAWSPVGAEGGCIGGKISVTVEVANCDCG